MDYHHKDGKQTIDSLGTSVAGIYVRSATPTRNRECKRGRALTESDSQQRPTGNSEGGRNQ